MNLSLGSNQPSDACDDEPHKAVIDHLRAVGMATVVASGNAGATSAIASPACVRLRSASGRPPKRTGFGLLQRRAVALAARARRIDRVVAAPRWYGALSGTSMAAAHVSGAFAVMRQACPRLTSPPSRCVPPDRLADCRRAAFWRHDRAAPPLVRGAGVPRARAEPRSTHHVAHAERCACRRPGVVADDRRQRLRRVLGRPVERVAAADEGCQRQAADRPDCGGRYRQRGSALVSVSTPAPGGGTSSALPFTIDPPPTLTPSATRVAPGSDVTVTLANGFGGAWTGSPSRQRVRPTTLTSSRCSSGRASRAARGR